MARRHNLIERAKQSAAAKHPGAKIKTRSVRGRPVVLAIEGNVIHLVRFQGGTQREKPRKGRRARARK